LFFEFAHFLADLMAVDGALVVTKRLELVGFGAETARGGTEPGQRSAGLELGS
jgi:hypothetical protein